ncbi:MAG: hypothetical protein MUO23_12570 [Anaerolineales bacterium]|nr:hypothetical protein [Anaerolineales bacterium]
MTQVHLKAPDGTYGVAKAYQNARKLFPLGKEPAVGVVTFGAGSLGARTIYGLVLEFSRERHGNSVQDVAQALHAFIKGHYDAAFGQAPLDQRPPLGFYIAGYSDRKALAEEWEFILPRADTATKVRPDDAYGASWRGIDFPFTRLHFGFDPRMRLYLQQAGVSEEILAPIFGEKIFSSPVAFEGMPIQDAINFAVYVLRTTIGFTSFELGPPACGGPLQVAAITHESGFQWVKEPKYRIEDDSNG